MHGQGDFRNTIYEFGTSDQGTHYDMLGYKVATNYEDFLLSSEDSKICLAPCIIMQSSNQPW